MAIPYPSFDPNIVSFGPYRMLGRSVGPFSLRWYALAYIAGLVIGWRLTRRLVQRTPAVATPLQVDDFLTWATLGVVIGGRLGYVLFYQPSLFLAHPLTIFALWTGGMASHGGFLGVTIAIVLFCRVNRIPVLGFADRIAIVAPIGLAFGRVANFINGELWGRPAPDWLPWAMVFPRGGPIPRHPSQLYEALMEGVVLFSLMWLLGRRARVRARFGLLTGTFLAGYAVARIVTECFREPDAFLGFLYGGATMGQLLSIPVFLAGLALIAFARSRPPAALPP
jgi:phosphatidylglycerol:prolipoprotein diacylglycerol transferase